jgi:hypothetical protein
VVRLRAYLRHRERLIEYAASHIQHMQKALMQMNVQLHHVVSDITGATGMRIMRAIVEGNHAPERLAEFRDVRCAASEATIRAALTGNYRAEHLFALRHALELYDFHQAKIAECDCPPSGTRRRKMNPSSTRGSHYTRCSARISPRSTASVSTPSCGWSPNVVTI